MNRTSLIAYRSSVVTPDLAEALRQLEVQAKAMGGIRIQYKGVSAREASWKGVAAEPGATECPAPISLRPAGREVSLRVQLLDDSGPEENRRAREVATLWALVVPLGFTPWNRYPLPGAADDLFHFLGPWQQVFDHLCGEGRGEIAWASVCAAAQTDVGAWEAGKTTERFVQAQLHRIGLNCGPVDGEIGERTAATLRSLGLKGKPLDEVAKQVSKTEAATPSVGRHMGYVVAPGRPLAVTSYGKIATTRTPHGVSLTIDGPGRVVIDVGQTEAT